MNSIEKLRELLCKFDSECPGFFEFNPEPLADWLIEQGVTVGLNPWISVADKLPETIPCTAGTAYSEAVVVITNNKIILTAVFDGTDFICDASFWEAEGDEITHWKPVLPLPDD